MTGPDKSRQELLQENEELRLRLEEAEDTLRAIQHGEVDAIAVYAPEGDRIYTLQGAEHPYRIFFEEMNEGAVTMALDGTILYCNLRFSTMTKVQPEKIAGMSFLAFVAENERQTASVKMAERASSNLSFESTLTARDGSVLPVSISMKSFTSENMDLVCALVMDLSELMIRKNLEAANRQLSAMNVEIASARDSLKDSDRMLRDSRLAALNVAEDAIEARRQTDETNKELLREITERKKAEEEIKLQVEKLHAANEELERFNRAAVGRELRMVELKREINKLCETAGQAPRYKVDFEE